MKRFISAIILSVCCLLAAAQTPSTAVIALNNPGDGSIVVRANGTARNSIVARTDAVRVALRTVIFKGVNVPGSESLSKPLIREIGAEEKYEEFFNDFFSKRSNYDRFANRISDRRLFTTKFSPQGPQTTVQVTIKVERQKLKNYLIEQGIIVK